MLEVRELVDMNNGLLQVSRFFAVRLEEIEKEVQEESARPAPRSSSPTFPLRQQTARPQRLYTYD